jgi:hypothetical protein
MSNAGSVNFVVDQGADWRRDIVLTDATGATCDLSGYTDVTAYCARKHNDSAAIEMSATFIDADNQPAANGDSTGKIRLSMTATQTASIDWTSGYHDVWATEPSGNRIRILQGQMPVRPKVPGGAA